VVLALHVVVEEVGIEGGLDKAAGVHDEVVVVVLLGVGPVDL
jgi:hypothetical protein